MHTTLLVVVSMHMHSTARTLIARSTIVAMHSFYGIPVAYYTTTTTTTTTTTPRVV